MGEKIKNKTEPSDSLRMPQATYGGLSLIFQGSMCRTERPKTLKPFLQTFHRTIAGKSDLLTH